MRILVVGQSVKDIYLQITGDFLRDENNIPHLDLAFDGTERPLLRRTAVKSGSSIAAEVLHRLGHQVDYLDDNFLAHRYILNNGENSVVLAGSQEQVFWQQPAEKPDVIYVDNADLLSNSDLQKIAKYAEQNNVIFCGYGGKTPTTATLWQSSDFAQKLALNRLEISIHDLIYGTNLEFAKAGVETRKNLTTLANSALFGAWLLGYGTVDCVALTKAMIENSTLTHTPRLAELRDLLPDLRRQVSVIGPELAQTAQRILSRGILAADESGGSIAKKFATMNIPDDAEHRRDYRNIFIGTPELTQYVGAVIMFDETTAQLADNGQNFTDFLNRQGIVAGVKVDQGLVDLYKNSADPAKQAEKLTQGLDGLPARLADYRSRGLRFAKWRAAFFVGDGTPSAKAIDENCKTLAQYALDCQSADIVPIVEPELVHDGNYSIEQCTEITEKILIKLFAYLQEYKVDLSATILKTNMILAGKKHKKPSTPEQVGKATADLLKKVVPREIAGVVFLSGGQTPEQATANLKAVWSHAPFLWPITFSFARALQDPAIVAWQGDNKNLQKARKAFLKRLIANSR
ncbi:MAG: fructose-bisphosphate aldolase class I [Candidatus Nomurabacteria bacterium]|jgi:fructose-bisphosphate aldolase class I|nr:fructose-bisphosphate aldolase class I [Candidatus Nomurabacteria bacterium]